MAVEAASCEIAVLDVVEAQRREIRKSATEQIKKVKERRDRELRKLDQVAAVLDRAAQEPARAGAGARRPSAKRRRRRRRPTPATAALERREAIYRYLLEQGRPVATGEIRRSLRISEFSTTTALKRLIEEGRIRRIGTGVATRYKTTVDAADGPDRQGSERGAVEGGTGQGRILATLEDRTSASLGELAQALREPEEKVRSECGRLIREGEICMGRRDGRPVYLRQGLG
jgi:hypothetical protein